MSKSVTITISDTIGCDQVVWKITFLLHLILCGMFNFIPSPVDKCDVYIIAILQ